MVARGAVAVALGTAALAAGAIVFGLATLITLIGAEHDDRSDS